jgi:hypothetical protein
MITNMAVCPTLRRRGISHQLMQAAVKAALVDLDISPSFALLLAYKYYEPAMRCVGRDRQGFRGEPCGGMKVLPIIPSFALLLAHK